MKLFLGPDPAFPKSVISGLLLAIGSGEAELARSSSVMVPRSTVGLERDSQRTSEDAIEDGLSMENCLMEQCEPFKRFGGCKSNESGCDVTEIFFSI